MISPASTIPLQRTLSMFQLRRSADQGRSRKASFHAEICAADGLVPLRSFSCGFTLIELLVVIVILGVLGSLVAPTIQNSIAKGRIVACASNLKQIFLGLESYAADNNNSLPPSYATNASGGRIGNIPYLLSPYIPGYDQWGGSSNSRGVYTCPEMLRQPGVNTIASHYAVNGLLWNGFLPVKIPLADPLPQALFSRPSQTILMGDNHWTIASISSTIDNAIQPGVDERNAVKPISTPPSHARGGANLLFADGHVEYWSDTSVLCTDINYRNHGSKDLWNIQK